MIYRPEERPTYKQPYNQSGGISAIETEEGKRVLWALVPPLSTSDVHEVLREHIRQGSASISCGECPPSTARVSLSRK